MPPAFSVPQPPPYPYYGSAAGYWEHHLAGKIDNTKTGLLLLVIGLAISWIPFIGAIGGLVALIGACWLFLDVRLSDVNMPETPYWHSYSSS